MSADQPTPLRHGGPGPTEAQLAEWQGEVAVLITCANIRASVAERLSDLFARFLAALAASREENAELRKLLEARKGEYE